MSITLSKKKEIIKKIENIAKNAKSIILTHCSGLSSPEITDLRSKARVKNVELLVAKNTLLKRGFKNTSYESLEQYLKGQSLLFFSSKELNVSAKVVNEFCKTNSKLTVNAISLSGKIFTSKDLLYVSNLPTRKEAVLSILLLLKTPINKLVRTLKCPNLKLVTLLKEINKKK